MYKQFYFLAALIFWATISQSQEVPGAVETKKKGCSCAFSSIYSVGIIEGENGTSLQLQTVQGIRYGKWFAGIGAGLDYYHLRTIPLFLDIRREFFNGKNAPFIYADGGYHFAWARDRDKSQWTKIDYDGGLFYDVGLGYRIATAGKQKGFLISAGYSFKYLKESRSSQVCINWNCQEETNEWFKYKLNRLSLKIGMKL
jgi:hypothetical protein